MIQRIFHPIGQGAFYSERHENFNIVYDCGNWRNTKLADKVVRQAFQEDDAIDILFISHFDYDHVNKIKTLKNHTKIRKVIMPLLHNNEKVLLINLYRVLDFHIATLIQDPKTFFGEETQIITVEPSESNEAPINDNIEINLDNIDRPRIQSGSKLIKQFSNYEWLFIPFNYKYPDRNTKLECLLSAYGFDIVKLKEDPEYTVKSVVSNRKEIKDIYSKVDGNINQNSMILYSGINHKNTRCNKKLIYSCHRYCHHIYDDCFCHQIRWHRIRNQIHRVSCIYTGDTDLNIVNIKSIFKNYWKSVGTIQIPHHGDLKSFNKAVLDDKHYCCPISVGAKNNYGHPSFRLISEIFSQDSCPILITEDLSSGFVEHIRLL